MPWASWTTPPPPNARELLVLVPKPDSRAAALIDKGSGIVTDMAAIREDGTVMVYFEGARYAVMTYTEKVRHAADRLIAHYPTIARAALPFSDFVAVGVYDARDASLPLVIDNERALDQWRA